jgi:type II restriction/modification system DNA methylase subunit YeeA
MYNFTVDENTSYDVELSIDPEMLGRIFENLLAEINPETGESAKKSTGAFYTPRDIVDYMVDSSLIDYLKTKTEIDENKLRSVISYSYGDNEIKNVSDQEKKDIIDSLYSLTALDPACGSGAFPIGLLQKIVYILQQLDPSAKLWFNKACEGVPFTFRKEIEKKFEAKSLDYIRKLIVIQNSIFGVDIQPIAVEIARIRCFLSLIIEEEVKDSE